MFQQLLTPIQVQDELGVTWAELFAMIKSNQITSYCIYGTFRFKPSDVEACRRALFVACFNPCSVA